MISNALLLLSVLYLVVVIIIFLTKYDDKNWFKYMWLLVIMIFIVAYVYMPTLDRGSDFYSYFDQIQNCRNHSFQEVNDYYTFNWKDNLILRNFIFWITGNFLNPHILFAISVAIVYGIGFYIIENYSKNQNFLSNSWIVIFLQFMELPFFGILTNVRNVFAFSIIIFATYRDVIQHKRNITTFILYILPIFYHSSALILVLIRLIIPIIKRIKYLILILIFFLPGIINLLYSKITSLPVFLAPLINKSYNYLNNDIATEWGNIVATSGFFIVQKGLMMTFAILAIILIYLTLNNTVNLNQDFFYFNLCIWILTIGCTVFSVPHYWRFYCAGIISFSPVLSLQIKEWKKYTLFSKYIFIAIIVLSVSLACLFILSTKNSY